MVHSSLSSFGTVDGGARVVADALVRAVSPGGSVFVPTFTYGKQPFDPATTPSLDGAITEAVRMLLGAVRSRHPTHSVAGVGPDAAAILGGHEHVTPFGPSSPLWRMWERGASVLLIGVNHRANSMIHVAEESLGLPRPVRTRTAQVVLADGTIEAVELRRPGCSRGFNKLDGPLRGAGRVRETYAGASRLMLMRSADVVETAAATLARDPAALLCDVRGCAFCDQVRRMIAEGR